MRPWLVGLILVLVANGSLINFALPQQEFGCTCAAGPDWLNVQDLDVVFAYNPAVPLAPGQISSSLQCQGFSPLPVIPLVVRLRKN